MYSSSKSSKSYTEWDNFDPEEYVLRNYGVSISHEDKMLIKAFFDYVAECGLQESPFKNVIDIGAGPNLYPSMLWVPYCAENATIILSDYSKANLDYLNNLRSIRNLDQLKVWQMFEDYMTMEGGHIYKGALNKLVNQMRTEKKSVYSLGHQSYDVVISFFVTESITDQGEEFLTATTSLFNAVRSGGYLVTAHMLGSEGYNAGVGTSFPAVSMSSHNLENVYKAYNYKNLKFFAFDHTHNKAVREGYTGMALVILQKA